MAAKCLVRARGHAGAPLRHLDPDVLRTALSGLLRDEWDDGYLIYQLVVEGAEPALVARERGVSRPALVELLRDAVDALAIQYEDVANGCLDDTPALRLTTTLARKRGEVSRPRVQGHQAASRPSRRRPSIPPTRAGAPSVGRGALGDRGHPAHACRGTKATPGLRRSGVSSRPRMQGHRDALLHWVTSRRRVQGHQRKLLAGTRLAYH
jgi:hypothetical protein